MNIEKELFDNFCFLPAWNEIETQEQPQQAREHKDLTVLLAELEEIKNRIEDIRAREWHLAKLIKFHNNKVPQ